ncbi:pilus assembly protein [Rhizobium halophytocola]|nr:pilus assembly protein [Rhizobium halophytocola]
MISKSTLKKILHGIAFDRRGNFGVATAILLPVLLASGGVAMDLTRMVQIRSELQNAADSAALAAASAMASKGMSEEDAIQLAKKFLASQMANLYTGAELSAEEQAEMQKNMQDDTAVIANKTVKDGNAAFDVTVQAGYNLALNPMTQLLGWKTASLAASSSAKSTAETQNAISMYLVLDKSGSMAWRTDTINTAQSKCINWTAQNWGNSKTKATSPCYVTKIATLQVATESLMNQLKIVDPDSKFVRTAAVSYNGDVQPESDFAWGTSKALSYVKALDAEGSTASTKAVKLAYTTLVSQQEDQAHKAKNGQVPDKFILFMTDGDNNSSSDNTATLKWCDDAKKQNITVYTVAFMAPSGGKALLSACASSSKNYYDAQDADQLIAAFAKIGEEAAAAGTRLTN